MFFLQIFLLNLMLLLLSIFQVFPVRTKVFPENLSSPSSSFSLLIFIPASFNLFNKSLVCSCSKILLYYSPQLVQFPLLIQLSIVASNKLSIFSYLFAKILAAFVPTCLIPNAVINLYKSFCLLAFMLSIKFCANFLPFFFNDAISSNSNHICLQYLQSFFSLVIFYNTFS